MTAPGASGGVPLAGRTALVTGASRGIGLATARALASRGARVALLARREAPLADAAGKVGEGALALPADVTDPESVRGAFHAVQGAFGGLDVLVNNAAIGRLHRLEQASDADLRDTVATNLLGVLYCTRAAIPLLRARGGGHVVNVSSESVRDPLPFLGVYAATKGALEVLSLALKSELAPDRIRVTLLRAGASSAGFAADWDPQHTQEALRVWRAQGFLTRLGAPMAPATIAESIVHAVTRPPGASVDLLEIRSAGPAAGAWEEER